MGDYFYGSSPITLLRRQLPGGYCELGSGKGAVTWGSETICAGGTVSASNSLVGSLDYSTDLSGFGGDLVGYNGIAILSNGIT